MNADRNEDVKSFLFLLLPLPLHFLNPFNPRSSAANNPSKFSYSKKRWRKLIRHLLVVVENHEMEVSV
jgi:hypothetical protein